MLNFYGTVIILADKQDESGKVILEYVENSKNVFCSKEHLAREFDSWEEAVNYIVVWNRLQHLCWWEPFYKDSWLVQT